jgi:hypothetical protein
VAAELLHDPGDVRGTMVCGSSSEPPVEVDRLVVRVVVVGSITGTTSVIVLPFTAEAG